jgi:hypothetical protein
MGKVQIISMAHAQKMEKLTAGDCRTHRRRWQNSLQDMAELTAGESGVTGEMDGVTGCAIARPGRQQPIKGCGVTKGSKRMVWRTLLV